MDLERGCLLEQEERFWLVGDVKVEKESQDKKNSKVVTIGKRKDIEVTKEEEGVIIGLLVSLVIFATVVYFRDSLGLVEKDDYPHGETYCIMFKGIPIYSNVPLV